MTDTKTVDYGICERHCTICEGQDHHWDFYGDTNADGDPVLSCKHCELIRPMDDDDD